ncbi:V-type ATP synthase subunit I [Hominiventricola filiformis]|uniref:V-type ATP synthase subunit I n=1 Tax=Hominiventricola filiformis TaxID=2885352 RepID=A0AAE3A4B1_9FIRM|nr:V-type ATP synthase subunit I [Hominiventricola filiformis]MCC2125822.1 V-type ATP synthase subunit I [Hominiventricola filiformis]
MAIVQMQRINICALKKNRKAILERLQELGAMEIDIQLEDDSLGEKQDVASSRALFERRAQTADQALAILNIYVPEKKGMLDSLAGKPLVEKELFEKAAENQDQYMATASRIVTLDKQIAESKAAVLKVQNQVEALAPWLSLTVPVSYTGTQKTAVLIGTMPNPQDQQNILNLLAGAVPDVEAVDVELISTDKDFTYLAVICMKQDAGKVEEVLRTGGFSKPSSPVQKIPEEYKKDLEAEIAKAQEQVKQLESELVECAVSRQDLELISDYYRTRAEKYRILGEIPQTASTFAISGYVPAAKADAIVKDLSEHYGAAAETEGIKEEEEPPVLLHNNRFSESVEGVLASFGLPAKGEIDPTFFTSIFYVFLFGLMLSDAAYGLIVSLACGIVLLKFPRMETNLRKSVQLFFWCGLSTLFWGVLFGGYFGDALDVISETFFGHKISIPALWFVPLNEPMRMLLYSMLFGVIHLFTGLALKGYMYIRDHKYMDFVCDVIFWYMLLLGLIGLLIPSSMFAGIAGKQIVFPAALNAAAKWSAILGAVGIVLFSGRSSKNPALRIALGAYDLYNITGWLSDVLSYSRLLALGLATGVIASVVNQMGSMGGKSIGGVILFIIVFVIGHVFNMAINLLGAYVHTCRLQYVEFFGKFYEGGGKPFEPFKLKTKYVDLKEEK